MLHSSDCTRKTCLQLVIVVLSYYFLFVLTVDTPWNKSIKFSTDKNYNHQRADAALHSQRQVNYGIQMRHKQLISFDKNLKQLSMEADDCLTFIVQNVQSSIHSNVKNNKNGLLTMIEQRWSGFSSFSVWCYLYQNGFFPLIFFNL